MSDTKTYTVPGIHCGHCAAAIKEEVSSVESVEGVAVDLEANVVTIRGQALRTRRCARRSKGGVRGGLMAETARPERVRLGIEGMTCASCAAPSERKVNELWAGRPFHRAAALNARHLGATTPPPSRSDPRRLP